MLTFSRHLDLLAHDTMRAVGALGGADPTADVPGCPEWQVGDLLTHLIEMNDIWGWLVHHRPLDFTDGFEGVTIPIGHRERLDLLDSTNHQLVESLRASGPDEEICYFGERAPASRAARLMAVETLVHSRDAEESAGRVAGPIEQDAAVDAVDQQLCHLSDGGQAPWLPQAVLLASTDTDDSWTVLVAAGDDDGTLRLVGPGSVGSEIGARVAAPSAALAPWLFARTHDPSLVAVSGDPGLVRALRLGLGHEVGPAGPAPRRRWWRP